MRKRNGVRIGILGLIIAAAMMSPGVAVAADFRVTTTADGDDKECALDCTLREAVVLAGNSDRVVVPAGTYTLSMGELLLVSDTVVGAGARTTTIDAANASRVMAIADGTSRISGVTIMRGNGKGRAPGDFGGGILVEPGATMFLTDSTVRNNSTGQGGGIGVLGIAAVGTSTVSGNNASFLRQTRGGGIAVGADGGLILANATVSGNTAADQGGGTSSQGGGVFSGGLLSINYSTIANNTAADAGGGLYVIAPQSGTPTVQNSILSAGIANACAGPGIGSLNALNNVANDSSCQFKDPSNRNNANPALGTLANNGGQTDTHALGPASAAINAAGTCIAQDQRGIARPQTGSACDSGSFEYRAPTLKVVTAVINDAGGTRTPSQFTAHVRLGGTDVKGSPQAGDAEGTTYVLDAGFTYIVGADTVPGYTLALSGDCTTVGAVHLQEGENRTCTITANDIAPTLRVITGVTNNDGGTLAPGGVTVHARRSGVELTGSPAAGLPGPTGRLYTTQAGPHAVTADAVSGYSISLSADCTVTLALDQDATCTVTLDDIAPTLRVITTVTNNDGGSLAPGGVTVHARRNAVELTGSPAAGLPGPDGRLYTSQPGAHAVTADAVNGYSVTYSAGCTATLVLDQDATCTVTLDDLAPTLRVVTAVTNNDGGSLAPGGVTVNARRIGVQLAGSPAAGLPGPDGRLYTTQPGAHAVTANAVSGYSISYSAGCTVTLVLDQDATCTVTLDDIAPTLRVITTVNNNDGGTAAASQFSAHVKRNAADVAGSPRPGEGAPGTLYTLQAGAYDVLADGVAGYSATGSGECSEAGAITLALDQDATCTITMDDGAGELTVLTDVVNDDGGTAGPGSFSVSVRSGSQDVAGSPKPGSASGTSYPLAAGTYSVAAGAVPGYVTSVSGDCPSNGSITLPLLEQRTCRVTANDVAPRLTVITQVVNDHGGTATPGSFAVHVRRGGADVGGSPQAGNAGGTAYTLAAGAHTVSADAVSGYGTAISGDCAGDGSISLGVGDTRTCTITADDDAPPVRAQQQLPPPEPGKSVNALPKSGTVKVKLPGAKGYVTLAEGQQLPVGTLVDARNGHVTLIAAADRNGGTATAEFWAGIFKLGQTKAATPITTLTLVEKLSCPKRGKATAAAKKKKKRRLWGDGSGKFRTEGEFSSATVRGTRWLVEDRCTSTLTRVVRGRVAVRDKVKRKTVIVRAGKKYVATAKR